MSPIIEENWANLLSKDPPLPTDVQFRVTELHLDGNTLKRTEVLGAHKFVLSVVSDIFKALFDAQIREGMVEIPISGTSIEAFKEFLKLIYSLVSDGKNCAIKAEYWIEILNLCRKYEVEDAILLIQDRISSSNKGEGCIEEEFIMDLSDVKDIGKMEIKTDEYCILCQTFGHIVSEDCVSNAVCLECGVKGHVRKDCKRENCELKNVKWEGLKIETPECEEEYVEMDIKEDELKNDSSEVIDAVENVYTEKEIIQDDPKTKKSLMKKCAVQLVKVNIKTPRSPISSKGYPSKHIQVEKENNIYSCKKSKRNVVKPMKGVTYPCSQCNYEARRKDHLKSHVKAVHEGVKYPCNQCDYKASQLSGLTVHIKAIHEGVKYKCTQCDKHYSLPCSLKNHVKTVHEGLRYTCTQCDYKTKHKGRLSVHIKVHHDGISFACEKCDFKSKSNKYLKTHVETVHEGLRHPCTQCDYKATCLNNLERHVKAVHKGVKYQCTQCDYKASIRSNLKRHVKSVHEEVTYPCTKCDYKATDKCSLKRHIRSMHEGNEVGILLYSCEQCDYKAKDSGILLKHIEAKHEDIMYPCDKCDYKVKYKNNISRHKQMVHGDVQNNCKKI